MLHATLAAVLLALELVSQVPDKESSWVVVRSEDGNFSFSMPTKPREQTMEIPSPIGKVNAKIYVGLVQDCALMAQQMNLPNSVPEQNVAGELQAAKKSAGVNLPKLISEKPIRVGDVTGIELVHSGPMGPDKRERTVKLHMYIYGAKACSLIVVSAPEKPLPPEAARFLASIRFGDKPAGVSGPAMASGKPALAKSAAATPAKRKRLAKIDLVDKTPEDALRTFMMAIAAADEQTLRAVTLANSDLDVLLTGAGPPFKGVKEMKQEMQKMKVERLKVGDQVKMPGNKVHVIRATEVGQDRATLLPEDAPFPTRLRLVSGHWKVDAAPIIAARKAAGAARK